MEWPIYKSSSLAIKGARSKVQCRQKTKFFKVLITTPFSVLYVCKMICCILGTIYEECNITLILFICLFLKRSHVKFNVQVNVHDI